MNTSLSIDAPGGVIGAVYGIPKLVFAHTFMNTTQNTAAIPQIPVIPPATVKMIRSIAAVSYILGIIYQHTADTATTISVGAPIRPAFIAASPITRPPTILTA